MRKKELVDDFNTHRTRGAFDNLDRLFGACRVKVFFLNLDDFLDLSARYFADLVGVGLCARRFDFRGLFEKNRSRRGFENERERRK